MYTQCMKSESKDCLNSDETKSFLIIEAMFTIHCMQVVYMRTNSMRTQSVVWKHSLTNHVEKCYAVLFLILPLALHHGCKSYIAFSLVRKVTFRKTQFWKPFPCLQTVRIQILLAPYHFHVRGQKFLNKTYMQWIWHNSE